MEELELRTQEEAQERLLQIRKQGRRAYVTFAWALVVLLIAQIVLPLFAGMIMSWVAPWLLMDLNLTLLITYGSMYLLGFPLILLMLGGIPDRMPSRPVEADERLGPGRIFILYTILAALSNIIVMTADYYFGILDYDITQPLEELMGGAADPWLVSFLAVIVAPVMEEIIFRWLPYRKLSGYGMRYYVIWTSVAFGLFHLNFLQALYAGAMGVIFAIVMYRTGSIKYSIILHLLVNLTSGLGLGGLLVQGGELTTAIYGIFNLAIYAIGVVMLIRYLVKKRFSLRDIYETQTLESWRSAFLCVGYVLFVAFCLALIIFFG